MKFVLTIFAGVSALLLVSVAAFAAPHSESTKDPGYWTGKCRPNEVVYMGLCVDKKHFH